MPDQCSELVEISKLNGDFRRNYGKVLGAILYLRSVSRRAWTFLVLGRHGFLRLFGRVGLDGAAWLDEVNRALISAITSSTVSTRTAL